MSDEHTWASKEIYEMIKNIHESVGMQGEMLKKIADAQAEMGSAAKLIALTHERIEKRYEKLEDRLQDANDKAAGKGQIPLNSHYLTLGGTVLLFVLVFVAATQYTIDATVNGFKFMKAGQVEGP